MQNFTYGNYSYSYQLIRQDRKSLALTVKPDLGIVLKCPYQADKERIDSFLKRKWFWMNKQIDFFKSIERRRQNLEYISGESITYLGRQYKILVKRSSEEGVALRRGVLEISTMQGVRNGEYNKVLVQNWLKEKRNIFFQDRYTEMLRKFDYKAAPDLHIREMPKRWGSFTNKEKIMLHPKLIHTSRDCIDYVITHELCHMTHKNHSSDFWKLLDKKYPGWQEVKEKLEIRFGMY